MSTKLQFINLAYLELMSDGDEDMKQTMIDMLLEELPTEMEKMALLIQEENWAELREVSHKMKSTLAFVGNPTLTDTNQRIEDISKSENGLAELPTLMAKLAATYPHALAELEQVRTGTV